MTGDDHALGTEVVAKLAQIVGQTRDSHRNRHRIAETVARVVGGDRPATRLCERGLYVDEFDEPDRRLMNQQKGCAPLGAHRTIVRLPERAGRIALAAGKSARADPA